MLIWDNDYSKLISYLKEQREKPFLIADENTNKVCGKTIEEKLKRENINYDLLILPKNAHADEKHICKVLLHTDDNPILISIGSGSLTDIVRFVAYKLKLRFISVPTAPSMDGYASSVAALTIDNLKTTVNAKNPEMIFSNLNIIKNSPDILKKAGFGDLIGKFTALTDWKLANLLVDETFNEDVAEEMYRACEITLKNIEKEDFDKLLLESLVKSGELMTIVGNSRPASGSEHHIAHYLEFLGYNLYHGIKVGLATIYVIRLYEKLLELDLNKIDEYSNFHIDMEFWKKEIKENFPRIYKRIIEENKERIALFNDPNYREKLLNKIYINRDKIYALARSLVDKKKEILDAYEKMNFPTDHRKWKINKEDIKRAIQYSLYIRDRFTILTLFQFLGILKNIIKGL